MNDTQRRAKLYESAAQKGITRQRMDEIIDLFGLQAAEFALQQAQPGKASKDLSIGYKGKTTMNIDEINKATAAMKKKALANVERFTGKKSAGAKLSVQIDATILENMRNQVGVPQGVWDVMIRKYTDQDLYQLLTDAGAVLPTEKARKAGDPFWVGDSFYGTKLVQTPARPYFDDGFYDARNKPKGKGK